MDTVTLIIMTCDWDETTAVYRYQLDTSLLVDLHCDSEHERPEKQVKKILDSLGYQGNIINVGKDWTDDF